jgi:hypothetical protein
MKWKLFYIFLARTMYMYALSQSEKVRCAPFESKHILVAIKMTREKKKERKQTPQQRTMHTGTKYKQPLSLQQLLIDNKQQTTT